MKKVTWLKSIVAIWIGIGIVTGANAKGVDDIGLSGDIIGKVECIEGPLGDGGPLGFPSFLVYIAGTSYTATTDSEGNFRLSHVQAGPHTVNIGMMFGYVFPLESFPDVKVIRGRVVNMGTKEIECDNFFGPA